MTPTMHDILEVSAAIGAETGDWKRGGLGWSKPVGGEIHLSACGKVDPVELDAQVKRTAVKLGELGWVILNDGDEWEIYKPNETLDGCQIVRHSVYNTAVYEAAKKVKEIEAK